MRLDVGMGVPRVALGVVNLNHAHAARREANPHQATARRASCPV